MLKAKIPMIIYVRRRLQNFEVSSRPSPFASVEADTVPFGGDDDGAAGVPAIGAAVSETIETGRVIVWVTGAAVGVIIETGEEVAGTMGGDDSTAGRVVRLPTTVPLSLVDGSMSLSTSSGVGVSETGFMETGVSTTGESTGLRVKETAEGSSCSMENGADVVGIPVTTGAAVGALEGTPVASFFAFEGAFVGICSV